MERFDGRRHLSFAAALARLPGPGGERFGEVFRHGSLLVELYAPLGHDPQGPHDRDEIYVVVRGGGVFVVGRERRPFEAGDVLFAPAGTTHRFEDFRDLAVWVFFYGPPGGETPRRSA